MAQETRPECSEPEAKRARLSERKEAWERAKRSEGLDDCRTYELDIQGWGLAEGGQSDEFRSDAKNSSPEVDFGDGRLFRARLARYGAVSLGAAEERGDEDMAPLEFQLVAPRGCPNEPAGVPSDRWPPHFRLFAYQCVAAAGRPPSGNFEELLDTGKVSFMRDADHLPGGALAKTLALAFTLPGNGAGCERVGVSHELLHQSMDALIESGDQLHLVLAVPSPERQIAGQFVTDNGIRVAGASDDGSEESDDEDEDEAGEKEG